MATRIWRALPIALLGFSAALPARARETDEQRRLLGPRPRSTPSAVPAGTRVAPPPQPGAGRSQTAARAAAAGHEVTITVGGLAYTTDFESFYALPGGREPPDPFTTKGAWTAVDAQYELRTWLAVATRLRAGWLEHSPPTTPGDTLDPPDRDLSSLDPQLGDSNLGGSVNARASLRSSTVAFDFGVTHGWGSFRMRYPGTSLSYGDTCGDCYDGQEGFRTLRWYPTLRLSRVGTGFFYAVGTGEGFVRAHAPGLFELLLGSRQEESAFMVGVARGLVARVDARLTGSWWLSSDLSFKPGGREVPGEASSRWIGAFTLSYRCSTRAPL